MVEPKKRKPRSTSSTRKKRTTKRKVEKAETQESQEQVEQPVTTQAEVVDTEPSETKETLFSFPPLGGEPERTYDLSQPPPAPVEEPEQESMPDGLEGVKALEWALGFTQYKLKDVMDWADRGDRIVICTADGKKPIVYKQ